MKWYKRLFFPGRFLCSARVPRFSARKSQHFRVWALIKLYSHKSQLDGLVVGCIPMYSLLTRQQALFSLYLKDLRSWKQTKRCKCIFLSFSLHVFEQQNLNISGCEPRLSIWSNCALTKRDSTGSLSVVYQCIHYWQDGKRYFSSVRVNPNKVMHRCFLGAFSVALRACHVFLGPKLNISGCGEHWLNIGFWGADFQACFVIVLYTRPTAVPWVRRRARAWEREHQAISVVVIIRPLERRQRHVPALGDFNDMQITTDASGGRQRRFQRWVVFGPLASSPRASVASRSCFQ